MGRGGELAKRCQGFKLFSWRLKPHSILFAKIVLRQTASREVQQKGAGTRTLCAISFRTGSSAAGATNTQETLSAALGRPRPRQPESKCLASKSAGGKEKKTHRESSSSRNEHPILLFHPETSRSRRPPEVPCALGTFRTAVAAETACCKRSEAWSPFLWGLGCPAVGGCLHTRASKPITCVQMGRGTDRHSKSRSAAPLQRRKPPRAAEPLGTSS